MMGKGSQIQWLSPLRRPRFVDSSVSEILMFRSFLSGSFYPFHPASSCMFQQHPGKEGGFPQLCWFNPTIYIYIYYISTINHSNFPIVLVMSTNPLYQSTFQLKIINILSLVSFSQFKIS
jgi:hypothetical protein